MEPNQKAIAISINDLKLFGCPHCGYRSGYRSVSGQGSSVWRCGSEECGKFCCVLAEGITKSTIRFGSHFPELQDHPRRGIPCHGNPDKKVGASGEFFRSRGIGVDECTCFVCGINDRDGYGHNYLHNIAAFVQCKVAGERIIALFQQGARLDYREHSPDRVQVKIGACDSHLTNLQKLDKLTQGGVISLGRIKEAMKV